MVPHSLNIACLLWQKPGKYKPYLSALRSPGTAPVVSYGIFRKKHCFSWLSKAATARLFPIFMSTKHLRRISKRCCQLIHGLLGYGVSWPVVFWEMVSADPWPVGRSCQLTSGLLGGGVCWPVDCWGGGVSWLVVCWEVVSTDQWCLLLLCSFYFSKLGVANKCFSIFNYKISSWCIPNTSQNCNCI